MSELAVPELVQMLRRAQVLEPVLTEVAQPRGVANELSRRRRDEDLAAMTRAGDPRAGVNVEPDIALRSHDWLPGMDSHPHAHRASGEGALRVVRGRDGFIGVWERYEEGIPLGVDLDPVVRRDGAT